MHYRLFKEPLPPDCGELPEDWGDIAKHLREAGDAKKPVLFQISSWDYPFPVPWGLLYDRYEGGASNLQSINDVDPDGFWGRRFDIYRATCGVQRHPLRGNGRAVKAVIGQHVPGNQDQQTFVQKLKGGANGGLVVQDIAKTADELRTWTRKGTAADLMYLFCHAGPAGDDSPDSWLGFGLEEGEDRACIEELKGLWDKQRPTSPVVILNACSSGQQDLLYGAPFVKFFTHVWQAQAFIGTDWPVHSGFADVLGQRLLTKILQEQLSLRDALRAVSNEAADVSNYFPLMYAVYGRSSVQFA